MCKLVALGVLTHGNPSEISKGFIINVRASFDFILMNHTSDSSLFRLRPQRHFYSICT